MHDPIRNVTSRKHTSFIIAHSWTAAAWTRRMYTTCALACSRDHIGMRIRHLTHWRTHGQPEQKWRGQNEIQTLRPPTQIKLLRGSREINCYWTFKHNPKSGYVSEEQVMCSLCMGVLHHKLANLKLKHKLAHMEHSLAGSVSSPDAIRTQLGAYVQRTYI